MDGTQLRATAAKLVAGALAICAVLTATGWLLSKKLQHTALVRSDESVNRSFAAHRSHTWNVVSHWASLCSETITVVVITAVAAIALRLLLHRWRESVFVALAVIGEAAIFVAVTTMVDRPRPPVPHQDEAPPTSSFPSGHVAAAIALYGALAVVAWSVRARPQLRGLATTAAVLVPLAVGLSRLYRGMHHPTDVIGGAMLGSSWLIVATMTLLMARPPRRPASTQADRMAIAG